MTNQEQEEWMAQVAAETERYSRERLEAAADLIARFTRLAAARGMSLSSESFEYCQKIGIVAKARGIANALMGQISSERDGLFPFDEIANRFPPGVHSEGCFVGPEFILMASSTFRRGMYPTNNWAPRFIELFWGFNDPRVRKYIALDEDRVRIDVDGGRFIERDTWYGAPFNKDIASIESGIAKLRPPLDIESRYISSLFADVYCLDIKWSDAPGVKNFQALEMKTENIKINVADRIYFPARYMHAEFDIANNCFRHFDGAIQYFTEEEYFFRRDCDFNVTIKNLAHIKARSSKVFKINGPLNVDDWVQFCSHFCVGNPLMFEYFGGEYPKHVIEQLSRLRSGT